MGENAQDLHTLHESSHHIIWAPLSSAANRPTAAHRSEPTPVIMLKASISDANAHELAEARFPRGAGNPIVAGDPWWMRSVEEVDLWSLVV